MAFFERFEKKDNVTGTHGEFHIHYFSPGFHGSAGALKETTGFEVRGGSGVFLVPKYVLGRGQALVWHFNTTGALSGAGALGDGPTNWTETGITGGLPHEDSEYPRWDEGAGVTEIQYYTSDGQFMGSGSVGKLAKGDPHQGVLLGPAPLVRFVISSSHNMRGYLYQSSIIPTTRAANGLPEGAFGVNTGNAPIF